MFCYVKNNDEFYPVYLVNNAAVEVMYDVPNRMRKRQRNSIYTFLSTEKRLCLFSSSLFNADYSMTQMVNRSPAICDDAFLHVSFYFIL